MLRSPSTSASVLLSSISVCLPVAVVGSHSIRNLITASDLLGVSWPVNFSVRGWETGCNILDWWKKRKFCGRSCTEKRLHPASGMYPKAATVPYWRFTWNLTCAWQALWLITSVPSWQFLSSTGCVKISRKLLTDKILKGDNISKTAQLSSLFFLPFFFLLLLF